jgi:Na+/melibiose symporter-like transporter
MENNNLMTIQTNSVTQSYVEQYFTDFCSMFEITGDGSLRSNKAKLESIQEWFNRSYVLISLIAGVPLFPIEFNELEQNNKQILLHVYAVSYTVLLRVCFILNRSVPEHYRPTILVEDEEFNEVESKSDN